MATTFKNLSENDRTSFRTLLHEAIPITGTIINSGTYNNENVKNFSHGLFQQVYDYPYLSSSANHIFDLSVGYSNNSSLSSSANTQNSAKINMYNQMAKVLMGIDVTGSIREFDQDGDLTGGTKLKEVVFLNFARILNKDEIKKGSFQLELGMSASYWAPNHETVLVKDTAATSSWKTNSPAGDYGILTASNNTGTPLTTDGSICGLVFYQAGVAVVTASLFSPAVSGGLLASTSLVEFNSGSTYISSVDEVLTGSSISGACDNIRQRWTNHNMNNTIELNSTVYFVRIGHNEFNYSANPTYLSGSKIRVKNNKQDPPVSYVTSVGLYSPDNVLMALAKLSEPLKVNNSSDITLRIRNDF